MKNFKIFISLFFLTFILQAQKVEVLVKDKPNSFRGLSVVSDDVLWVSGSNGTIGKSIDGGKTFSWMIVKGFEKTDFRDIEAFDDKTAIIMGVAEPAYILKTTDGGNNWKVVYENHTKGMFLDAMDFSNKKNGVVIGDPIDGNFFIAQTLDGGNTWQNFSNVHHKALEGEACFASSGSNIRFIKNKGFGFITGGIHSRFFSNGKFETLPILQGKETTGANSFAFNKNNFIIVGGDFMNRESSTENCVLLFVGKTMEPKIAPHGYRSCVEYLKKKDWITCGLTGVDYSIDNGHTWKLISDESFHVVRKAKKGKAVFLAGNGKIGKLNTK